MAMRKGTGIKSMESTFWADADHFCLYTSVRGSLDAIADDLQDIPKETVKYGDFWFERSQTVDEIGMATDSASSVLPRGFKI